MLGRAAADDHDLELAGGELGFGVAQLRDLLAAEQSTKVADEHQQRAPLCPGFAERVRLAVGIEDLEGPEALGEARHRLHCGWLSPPKASTVRAMSRRSEFEARGFIVVEGFADPERCAQLRDAALGLVSEAELREIDTVFDVDDQAHADDAWFLDSGAEVRAFLEPERDAGQPRINKIGHALHDRLPLFDRFSRAPELASLVAELGVEDPLLLQSMVIFKHPRVGGLVNPHQDATYLYTTPHSVIGLWFALEDASRDNGCLEVLPGAHREGLRSRYRREGTRTWTETLDPTPWPEQGWEALEVPTGTLVAFDGLLPHRSAANRSARSRCAYTLHLISGAAEYAADNWLQRPPGMPLRGF